MPNDSEWRAHAQDEKDKATEDADNAASDRERWLAEGRRHMAVHFLHWHPAPTVTP